MDGCWFVGLDGLVLDGWMNGGGWVQEWKNGEMDRWMSEYWTDGRMDKWADGYMD